ncbi:50S ribosomal protein L2 [candidate division WOR-3 bacterium]|nr:50S ribosomal protein L2 [candidate division WOR-3 bacterium]
MGLKSYNPVTPTQRFLKTDDFKDVTKKKPEKSLTRVLKKSGGRNNQGKVTSRHRGGGSKRKYRIVDFKRTRDGMSAEITAIEYDPNRGARIALLAYEDGVKSYIIAPQNLRVGDKVMSGEKLPPDTGNCMIIANIPTGIPVHNIELNPGKGAQLVRGAGTSATILAHEGKYSHIRLPSGEIRLISQKCRATVGMVSNPDYSNIHYGKAGKTRWLGRRPKVRGVAMNPVDHPLGGGEGRSSGGRHPVSPTGLPSKGFKTRKKKLSDKYIVKRKSKKRN